MAGGGENSNASTAMKVGSGAAGITAATGGFAAPVTVPLMIGSTLLGLGGGMLDSADAQSAQQAAAQKQLNEQTQQAAAQQSQTAGQPNQQALSQLRSMLPSLGASSGGLSGLSPAQMTSRSSNSSQGYL